MLEYLLGGGLVVFLIGLYVETRRKADRTRGVIASEKERIADDSGMTATLGVFTPDTQTTVIIGASEELGVFYYRMLRQHRVINRSRINLANLARVEFLVNGNPSPVETGNEQLTTSLRATDAADRLIGAMSNEEIKAIRRAGLRVDFYDEAGNVKTLEITTLRADDERHRFERVQLLKTTIWWTAYLQVASRNARHMVTRLTSDEPDDAQRPEEAPQAPGH